MDYVVPHARFILPVTQKGPASRLAAHNSALACFQPPHPRKTLFARDAKATMPAATGETAKSAAVPEQKQLPFAMNAQSMCAKNSIFFTTIISYPTAKRGQIWKKFNTSALPLGQKKNNKNPSSVSYLLAPSLRVSPTARFTSLPRQDAHSYVA